MRLKPEQLQAHLERNGLAPVYVISGEEPLQMIESADTIRRHARSEGYEERIVLDTAQGFDWQQLTDELANISLFSSKKLIELRMSKPGREGGALLADYAIDPPPDIVLLISCERLDKQAQKSKWYTALDKIGINLPVRPIDAARLPDWIRQRLRQQGKQINAEAANLIAERVEGNLLAAKQEIDKLCLLLEGNVISAEDVLRCVSDSTRFNVFELVESALAGDTRRSLRMLEGLRSEGLDPAGIYGAMMWDFRRLCAMAWQIDSGTPVEKVFADYRIWDNNRKAAIRATLKRHDLQSLHRLLRQADMIDRKIKSSDRLLVWDILQAFFLSIAGKSLFPAEAVS